jgi:hypothetical protein
LFGPIAGPGQPPDGVNPYYLLELVPERPRGIACEFLRFSSSRVALCRATIDRGIGSTSTFITGTTIHETDLQQVRRQDLLVFEFLAGGFSSIAIENEAVGAIPVLDDIQSFMEFPAERG